MASPKSVRIAAVPGILAIVPGNSCVHGGQAEYLGRRTCHKGTAETASIRAADGVKVLDDAECAHPADQKHNSEFGQKMHGHIFGQLRKLIREGSIAAADKATADWAGVKLAAADSTSRDSEDAQ